jgi:hypothetical protein
MFTQYLDLAVVSTDGSLMNGLMCCAFILNLKDFKFQLNSFISIFTAELLALCKALEALGNLPPGKFLLCTDSLSAIQGLQSPDFTHTLSLELYMIYHTLSKWDFRIPGYVGISSN